MLEHDEHRYYRLGRTLDGAEEYRLSVGASQGFVWNQDLFASKYHQRLSVSSASSPSSAPGMGLLEFGNESGVGGGGSRTRPPVEVHEIYPDGMSDEDEDGMESEEVSDSEGIFPKLEM